jgi:hypothetical protein
MSAIDLKADVMAKLKTHENDPKWKYWTLVLGMSGNDHLTRLDWNKRRISLPRQSIKPAAGRREKNIGKGGSAFFSLRSLML